MSTLTIKCEAKPKLKMQTLWSCLQNDATRDPISNKLSVIQKSIGLQLSSKKGLRLGIFKQFNISLKELRILWKAGEGTSRIFNKQAFLLPIACQPKLFRDITQ